jgi:hypothetical protein
VTQGTLQGAANPVSPNTGQLFTVGSLGVPVVGQVGFDIGSTDNNALASINNVLSRST